MLRFFLTAYLFAVAIIAGIAHFGPFAWFNYGAVMWFAGFLAVVLAIVYFVVRSQKSGSGSGSARATKHSKGAQGRDR